MREIKIKSRLPINKNEIEEFLKRLGLSDAKLAQRMGLSRQYVYLVLEGERNLGLAFLDGLRLLGMDNKSIFLP